MESVKLLASGLTLEESKAKRQEKQASRYRHRLGTYVPSGDSAGLLEALMATSPKKNPTPKRSMPTKQRKSVKISTKGNYSDGTVGDSMQETVKRTKLRKQTSRKSIKATDLREKEVDQGERSGKVSSRKSESRARTGVAKGGIEKEPKPSTSRQTDESTGVATSKTKTAKSSKKSAAVTTLQRSESSLSNADTEPYFDNQPPIQKRPKDKSKKFSAKPSSIQTDEESDELAIKTTKAPKKVDKGKARAMESLPETFESTGTDVYPEDSRLGPHNVKLLGGKVPGGASNTPPMTFPRRNASEEEQQQKTPLRKRGHPHNDEEGEEPSQKRGRTRKPNGSNHGKHSAGVKPKRQSKKLPPKPRSTGIRGGARKKVDASPQTRDETVSSGTEPPGSNTWKHRQQKLDRVSDDEKWSGPSLYRAKSDPNRVRLDSIPPEGIVIRKKNGIVERLLPPVTKPKRKAPTNRGKTRSSLRRTIPAHVLKYIGPTRFGSPLKAEGTDTDDDLNL